MICLSYEDYETDQKERHSFSLSTNLQQNFHFFDHPTRSLLPSVFYEMKVPFEKKKKKPKRRIRLIRRIKLVRSHPNAQINIEKIL